MKLVIIALLATFHATGAIVKYAHCRISDVEASGHVCFKEDTEDNLLEAHFFIRNLPKCSSVKIHIHENSPSKECSSLGGHFNVEDKDERDEGDLGRHRTFPSGGLHIHGLDLDENLSLDGAKNGIVGKSIALHSGQVKLCCQIRRCSEAMFRRMMDGVTEEPHTEC